MYKYSASHHSGYSGRVILVLHYIDEYIQPTNKNSLVSVDDVGVTLYLLNCLDINNYSLHG